MWPKRNSNLWLANLFVLSKAFYVSAVKMCEIIKVASWQQLKKHSSHKA